MSKRHLVPLPLVLLLCIAYTSLQAQDSTSLYKRIYNFPDKLFGAINSKSEDLQKKLTKQTDRYFTRLATQERKLKRSLWKKDSTAAKELFGDIDARYSQLKEKLIAPTRGNQSRNVYSGHMDSIRTALNFLEQSKLLKQSPQMQQQLEGIMLSYEQLQGKLNGTDQINKYLQERQQQLKNQMKKFGLTKQYRKLQKDVYYYRAQMEEYKKTFEDPQRLESRLLHLANKVPAFKSFFIKHSQLANLFRLPGSSDPLDGTSLSATGLQTRAMVQQEIQRRLGSGVKVNQMLNRNVHSAESEITQIKNKLNQLGAGSIDNDIPNFRPNSQKTKSFLKRVELGTNFQTSKSSSFFPVTTDIGLSAGFKLNDKSIIGIGGSYKLGWGTNIRHLKFSHQGLGLRSYVDWKLKGNFWLSGGAEFNYRSVFRNIDMLKDHRAWQKSGLVGISKSVSIRSKAFKKTKVQLLWDFLSYEQLPRTQPIIVRVGYEFKK